MKAEIKNIHSFDIDDLPNYRPPDPESFSFHLRIIAGPLSAPGEESFDLIVSTPTWLSNNYPKEAIIIGRHRLIVMEYNFERIRKTITDLWESCEAPNWNELAEKLARFGHWEFEDYEENKP